MTKLTMSPYFAGKIIRFPKEAILPLSEKQGNWGFYVMHTVRILPRQHFIPFYSYQAFHL